MANSNDKLQDDLELLRIRALLATRKSAESDQAAIQYLPPALIDYARSLAAMTAKERKANIVLKQQSGCEIAHSGDYSAAV
jgi:hypothetical protein